MEKFPALVTCVAYDSKHGNSFYWKILISLCPALPRALDDKFSSLKALTIYKSESGQDIDKLWQLINICDLEFFHLEGTDKLTESDKFSVRHLGLGFEAEPESAENLCAALLRALHRLEHLELNLRFRMDGAKLLDLARSCPRLIVLALPQARLCLYLALLTKSRPFWQLEIMHFTSIFFEDPRRLMESDGIQAIAAEWSRVFPKLRGMSCPADIYSSYMQEDDLNRESEGDRVCVSADEEMSDLSEESEGDMASVSADEEMLDLNEESERD
ncbi:hypothetical protein VE03_02073 [Pseudogymnoascus sp. 23342-1-I1]|nr:hypothetical protein VE03_02073 [Pseudogymnoascus sp. 23342-1-I1]